MPILSNTPTIRYITIQNLVVQDSNVYYPIVTTETSKKYIYWDKDSPYELICEDEILEDRANLYLLVINKKGNFTIVNQNSISVNFDGDIKINGINNKLNATVEKVDEHTKKFMSVTEDINGINKTVGTITEDLNETNEKLTNYKQTADQIAIDLQNTNKKYNDDKEFNRLRENITGSLISENTLLMGLNAAIKDITRDNNITEEEKNKIREIQNEIINKSDLLMIDVDKLITMLKKEELNDKLNQLQSIKEEYNNAFNLLKSTLKSAISGSVITPTQITILINCISNVSTKLTKLKNICDDIIFLGTGGTLYEEITKINMTASDITARVGSVETIQNSTNGKVAELETWKKDAELKITDDAITNTVKKSFYTKSETDNQITSKGYQTASQVQQTVNGLEVKIQESGGYNLLRNSAFTIENGEVYWLPLRWDIQAGGTNNINIRKIGDEWTLTNRNSLDASVTGLTSENANKPLRAGFDSSRFKVQSSATYTLYCLMACHRAKSITIEMLCYDSSGSRIAGNNSVVLTDVKTGGRNRQNWSVVKHVFTTQSNAIECHVRAYMNEWTGEQNSAYMWIAEPIVVEGDKDVIWTPSANEMYEGITTIDKDGIKVSMQDGEGSQGYTRIAHDGMEIFNSGGTRIAHFGDNESAYIKSLTAENIINDKLLRMSTGGTSHLYVAPGATGDGTGRDPNNRANSISNALEWFRKEYGSYRYQSDIEIHLAGGDYWGASHYIGGWVGSGVIHVIFDQWACIRSTILIEENTMPVIIRGSVDPYNIEVQDNAYLYMSGEAIGINIRNSHVVIAGLNLQKEGWYGDRNTWGNYQGYGVYAQHGSNVLITNCDMVGWWYGCRSSASSYVSILNCVGHVGCLGVAMDGGIISYDKALPISKDGFWRNTGGFLWNSGSIWDANSKFAYKADPPPEPPPAPPAPPPPPPEVWTWMENTFWASSLWTTVEGSGIATSAKTGKWGQGKWGSYKPHRGYASFSGINDWCYGGRNFTMELIMTRENSKHGVAGSVPVPKIKTTNGSFWNSGRSFARGATHTITLPSDVANALASGDWNRLEMWAGASTNDYSFYHDVKIRVVCEKRTQ